jgi:hypothetical protein
MPLELEACTRERVAGDRLIPGRVANAVAFTVRTCCSSAASRSLRALMLAFCCLSASSSPCCELPVLRLRPLSDFPCFHLGIRQLSSPHQLEPEASQCLPIVRIFIGARIATSYSQDGLRRFLGVSA